MKVIWALEKQVEKDDQLDVDISNSDLGLNHTIKVHTPDKSMVAKEPFDWSLLQEIIEYRQPH